MMHLLRRLKSFVSNTSIGNSVKLKVLPLFYVIVSINMWISPTYHSRYRNPSEPPHRQLFDDLFDYFWAINVVFSIGLYIESEVVHWILSGLTEEEFEYFLLNSFGSFIDSIALLVTFWEMGEFDIDCFKDFAELLVCLHLLSVGVNIVLHRCHTLFSQADNDETKKRDGSWSLICIGVVLFFFDFCCVVYSLFQFGWINGEWFYFQYAIRFIMLSADLIFPLLWCPAEFERLSTLDSPDPANAKYRLRTKQWHSIFKLVCIIVITWTSNNIFAHGFGFFNMYLYNHMLYGELPYSLLGYEILVNLKLDGTGVKDLHGATKKCILCSRDDLVPNNKTGVSQFSGDEAVKLVSCGHIFHYKCLMKWLKVERKCPTCKESVFKKRVGSGVKASVQVSTNTAPVVNGPDQKSQTELELGLKIKTE